MKTDCFIVFISRVPRRISYSFYHMLQGTAAAEAKDLLTDQHMLMSMGGMDSGPSATNTGGGNGTPPRKIVG